MHGVRKFRKIFSTMLFLFSFLNPPLFTYEKKSFTFADVVNLKRVSRLSLSPDGKQLLFTIEQADWDKNKYISHIWRVNTNGTGLTQMTNGNDGEEGGSWSPNGKYIAFVAKRNKESQIFFLNTTGGEAIEFSKHKGEVRSFQWSPDSKKIYFIASDPLSEKEEKKKKVKDDAFIFEKNYKQRHLWVIDIATKQEKRLTEGDFSVRNFNVSRKGKKILYSIAPTPLYEDIGEAEVWIMNLTTGSKKQITDNKIQEYNIELSPDENKILFLADANEKFEFYYQSTLFILPVEGRIPKLILPDFDYEIYYATWSVKGKKIFFVANMGVHSEIFSLNLKNNRVKQLTDGQHAIYRFNYVPTINTIVYKVNSPHNPGAIWIGKMGAFSPRLVYNPFPELKQYHLADYKVLQWKSTDGKMVEGILIYPLNYEKGKRYPLLAHTHGGPMSSDKFRFDGYAHARAARGYAIFKPNYRGSTGYGNEVLRDMVGHYFQHADDDVLTGIDFLVEKGIADPEKLGAMGWSAGGHMTNWLVTQTDRFKAASSGAGASNWISMYAQSDVRIYRTPWFRGNPWQKNSPLEVFRKHSPIFHIYKAKTPTLILFGQNDKRVPLPQGIEIYRGLKANNIPTELVIFPRAGHGPSELCHLLYKMNKEFQWLEKYIMGREFKFEEPPKTDKKKDKEK